jgi:peptidoglycan/xylan/chitin deacetylase (PgdA/CDA1 family)
VPGGADATRRDLTVSSEDFAAQVAWLSQNGYTSVTLAQVDAATRKLYTLPKKPVVFTFDDGYADVFENAVPILQQYSMVGSFAVVPGFLGSPDYATWSQVEAAKKGGMEIVSHTENHFDGSSAKFDAEYIKSNLEQSLRELDAHLGTVPRVLVYPYGHSTAAYVEVAKEVGFTMALTTRFGHYVDLDDLMHTARVRVHGGETLERFVEILTGEKKTAVGVQ